MRRNWWQWGVWIVSLTLIATGSAAPAPTVWFRSSDGRVRAEVGIQTFGGRTQGVLMLVGGNRRSAQQNAWIKFATDQHWALCEVRVAVPPPPKGKSIPKWEGETLAAKTTEALIVKSLAQSSLSGEPWYLYGSWDGAELAGALANGKFGKVAAWACNGATHFGPPARGMPYGIVAAGDQDPGFDRARDYAAQLRLREVSAVWISHAGRSVENPDLEAFVRGCFAALANANSKAIVVDNEQKAEVPKIGNPPEVIDTSVLPDASLLEAWAALHQPTKVVTETVATGVKSFPEIVLVLRLPRGRKHQQILAFSYYSSNVEEVLKRARSDDFFWNQFASQHDLAVLTWNVATLWQNLESFDQLSIDQNRAQNRTFDAVARAWDAGVVRLAKKYNLQDSNILIYGCSRGANFAVRLAAREPNRISAVVAHVANSFEQPSPAMSHTVWVMSNGELDPGVPNAKRYYAQCREMGLPVFLRFFPSLGHDENDESRKFSADFFDYILTEQDRTKALTANISKRLETPEFVADLNNYLVFPVSAREAVPVAQRIAIPDRSLAELWGRLRMPARTGKEPAKITDMARVSKPGQPPNLQSSNQRKLPSAGGNGFAASVRVEQFSKDRRTSVIECPEGKATFFYDEKDRVAKIEHSSSYTVVYTYGANGEITYQYIDPPRVKAPEKR